MPLKANHNLQKNISNIKDKKMKKISFLILFFLIFTANVFALEDDTLYKYINLDTCLSVGSTETYDKKGNERGMVSIGFLGNLALGLQYNRLRAELSYQERAEVSELVETMLGLVSTLYIRVGMVNIYYDYVRSKNFAMYVGTGIRFGLL